MANNTYDILRQVVMQAECKPGWRFMLVNDDGALSLYIQISDVNNYDHSEPWIVNHVHPVPLTTFNEKSWRRWVYEQCMRTMTHEIGEALNFDGVRPFAPMHGPGEDPYVVHEIRPEADALTTQDGSVRPGPV